MDLHRISVKCYAADAAAVDLEKITPVFHGWIQQSKVPGMLIDVADYRHMVDGPGVVILGHDVDYALDMAEGRPGLLHTRKRGMNGSLTDALTALFDGADAACQLLVQEQGIGFDAGEFKLTLIDRLAAPNEQATMDQLGGEIEAFCKARFGDASIERDGDDPRQCFSVRIKTAR